MSSGSESNDASSPEDEDETEKEDYDIITASHLEGKLREQSDLQIGGGSQDVLENKLDRLSVVIWSKAVDLAKRDDRKKVEPRDVEAAYQEILKPHNLIHQAIAKVEDIGWELEQVAEQSPFSAEDEFDD